MAVHVLSNKLVSPRPFSPPRSRAHWSASSSWRGLVPAGKSRGRRRKAEAYEILRPSARGGGGIRSSSTIRRKTVSPRPRDRAASSIARPTGSRGQMAEDRFTIDRERYRLALHARSGGHVKPLSLEVHRSPAAGDTPYL